jgi:PASTA domain
MTPPPIGQYVVCPQGLILSVESLPGPYGGVRDWLDAIIRDFSQPPNRIEFLLPSQMAKKKNDGSIYLLEEQLNLIKDYLPKFDYLIVDPYYSTYPEPDNFDIKNANHRVDHVFACRDAARLFIQYLRAWHITIPKIHWYINPEANLSNFGGDPDYVNAFKEYISFFIQVMMAVSTTEGLNVPPEFLCSPYFWSNTEGSVDKIRDLLLSVPKLSWMHVQDAVGAKAVKNTTTCQITYERYIDQVVNYFNQFIIPAAQQAHLKSLRVNLEMYVFDDQDTRNVVPAPPAQRAHSQKYYEQNNIPLGVTWEIRHWYASLYYIEVPCVKGKDLSSAQQAIQNADLVPIIDGPTISAEVIDLSPSGGTFVRPRSEVTLKTAHIVQP